MPFTLRISSDGDLLVSAAEAIDVRTWAAGADLVTIRGGSSSSSSWMCLSAGVNDLVVEVASQ
jgi:hypothetical protein